MPPKGCTHFGLAAGNNWHESRRRQNDLKGLLVWYGGARTERNLWIVLVIGMEHQPANVYLLLLVWEISKLDFSDAFQLPQIN